MERKLLVGTDTGLSLVEKRQNQSLTIRAVNESALEYTLTLCFDGSANLRFTPKRTDIAGINLTTFRVVLPPFQEKKVVAAGAPNSSLPFELVYNTSLEWRPAVPDLTYVSKLLAEVEDLTNGVTNPQMVAEASSPPLPYP